MPLFVIKDYCLSLLKGGVGISLLTNTISPSKKCILTQIMNQQINQEVTFHEFNRIKIPISMELTNYGT